MQGVRVSNLSNVNGYRCIINLELKMHQTQSVDVP